VDRERIERRDFPTGRRGYDPAAVDEHLRRVADEFEAHLNAPRASLADSTSEQVRLILDAAERGAAELRSQAGEQASDHIARVEAAAGGMLSKLDALESELSRLLGALRASGEHLAQGLAELQAEVSGAVPPPSPPPAAPSPPDPAPPVAASPSPDTASPPEAVEEAPDGAPTPLPDLGPFEEDFAADEPADAGARLIALNMALGGAPREETARYLAEHFELDDADALLDDVYERAGR
jgi:DivIVA domain-containing protein